MKFRIALVILAFTNAPIVYADYCDVMIYSKALGYSLKACQTSDSVENCGAIPVSNTTNPMAQTEGRDIGLLKLEEGDCPTERAVGTCLLASGEIVFYEGEHEVLQIGCERMLGTWQPIAPE